MLTLKGSLRAFLLFPVLIVSMLIGTASADELLETIPAESVFCLRANRLMNNLGKFDQFLMGATPAPVNTSMMVNMSLAGLLGDPKLSGVDMNGSFGIFAIPGNKPDADIFVAGLVPLTDYEQLISGKNNYRGPDSNDIIKITSRNMGGTEKTILLTHCGNFALLAGSDKYDRLCQLKKSMTEARFESMDKVLDDKQIQVSETSPIWLYANVERAAKVYKPLFLQKMARFRKMMESLPARQPGPKPEKMMDMYSTLLEKLLDEVKFISLTAEPQPRLLKISSKIKAVADSDMAEIFEGDSDESKNKLLGYLNNHAILNVAVSPGKQTLEKINRIFMDLMISMMGGEFSAEQKEQLDELVQKSLDSIGRDMVISWMMQDGNGSLFNFSWVYQVQDKDKLNKAIKEGFTFWNKSAFADMYKNMGLEFSYTLNPGADTYKGVSIDAAKATMKPVDINAPQAQMIQAMYRGGIVYRWAMLDDLFAGVTGRDVDSKIRKLIDLIKAGGPEYIPTEFKSAMDLIEDARKKDCIMTINYVRMFQTICNMLPMPLPKIDVQTESNILVAADAQTGVLSIDLALPKKHLQEISVVFQKMMQQQMKQQPDEKP